MPRCVSILLIFVCVASAAFTADPLSLSPVAIVHAGKDTFVSGIRVLDSMTIVAGDTIETRSSEFASVSLRGTSLRVLGHSRLTYRGNHAVLVSGQASVTTTTRFRLTSECFEVQPIDAANSQFEVTPYQGRIYVAAEQGAVLIKGKKAFHLPSGKTAAITACGTAAERIHVAGDSNFVAHLLYGSAAASGVTVPLLIRTPQQQVCISSESPDNCRR